MSAPTREQIKDAIWPASLPAIFTIEALDQSADAILALFAPVVEELEALRIQQRFGTPFDPTGVKTGVEIMSLRARLADALPLARAALNLHKAHCLTGPLRSAAIDSAMVAFTAACLALTPAQRARILGVAGSRMKVTIRMVRRALGENS